MSSRLTVGLPFQYQEKWVGGLYYVRNVVGALGLLPAEKRPRLAIIDDATESLDFLQAETGYPDLFRVAPADVRRIPTRSLNPLDWLRPGPPADAIEIDVVLLGSAPGLEERAIQWIPDFQEERFPHFFPAAELKARRKRNARWLAKHRHVMVSSQDVRGDLIRYYGRYDNRIHVIGFTSFIERELAGADQVALCARYSLPPRYFICNNQIWRHKNHAVILRALGVLAGEGAFPPVVFTGKEHDYRDKAYAPSIRALAAEVGVAEHVHFLGFLPRADQIGLLSAAIAVIQPSLCEGWSTVIEDAKAAGRFVLASDIAVNREQIDRNVEFFAPEDHQALAKLLRRYAASDPVVAAVDYEADKRRFAKALFAMLTEVERDFRDRKVARFVGMPRDRQA